MDDFWGVTILLVIIVVAMAAFFVRAFGYFGRHVDTRHARVSFLDVEPLLKSGDLVFFLSHTHDFTNSVFTGDFFTHSAMVVDVDGELCVSEATFTPVDEKDDFRGTKVRPLRYRLSNYPGSVFVMRLRDPLTPKQELHLRHLVGRRVPYPTMWELARGLLGFPAARARHCMQHVAWLLDELGLTPGDLARRGETLVGSCGIMAVTRRLTSLSGVALRNGNRYGKKYELLYDCDPVPPGDMR